MFAGLHVSHVGGLGLIKRDDTFENIPTPIALEPHYEVPAPPNDYPPPPHVPFVQIDPGVAQSLLVVQARDLCKRGNVPACTQVCEWGTEWSSDEMVRQACNSVVVDQCNRNDLSACNALCAAGNVQFCKQDATKLSAVAQTVSITPTATPWYKKPVVIGASAVGAVALTTIVALFAARR